MYVGNVYPYVLTKKNVYPCNMVVGSMYPFCNFNSFLFFFFSYAEVNGRHKRCLCSFSFLTFSFLDGVYQLGSAVGPAILMVAVMVHSSLSPHAPKKENASRRLGVINNHLTSLSHGNNGYCAVRCAYHFFFSFKAYI